MTTEQFIQHANNTLTNQTVISKLYGEGTVQNCRLSPDNDVLIDILFERIKKSFQLRLALKLKSIVFGDTVMNTRVLELLSHEAELKKEAEEQAKQAAAQKEAARQEALATLKAEKKAKRDEEKFEQAKQSAISKFKARSTQEYDIVGTQEEYYYTVGWLAANIGTVTARLPDYLENIFVSHFGADAHRYVIDSSRRTVNGYKPQWTYSFQASVRNRDVAPAMVLENLNEAGTKLANTSFIWNLIDNQEFKFGKTQDVEKIKKTVPDCYLEWFNKGFNAVD